MRRSLFLAVAILLAAGLVLQMPSSAQVGARGNYSVVLLVVDDFSGRTLDTVDTRQFDSGDNCTVSLEGQAFAVRGASDTPINETHGDLVYAQLEELIGDAGMNNAVRLVQVDIQGMATDAAANRIAAAINSHAADYYVVNMSFVIIPCEYITGFADFESQLMNARKEQISGGVPACGRILR